MSSTSIYTAIKPTYLYIKQHSITRLKYFGKTSKNPHKYQGSGKYWLKHINKHGKQFVKTIWVSDLYYDTSIKEIALHFSVENNIVESKDWANLVLENGLDGGFMHPKNKPLPWENEIAQQKRLTNLTNTTKKQIENGTFILLQKEIMDKVAEKNSIRGKLNFINGTSPLQKEESKIKSKEKLIKRIRANISNQTWGFQNTDLVNKVNSNNRLKILEGNFHTQTKEFSENQSKIQKNLVSSGNHMTQILWTCPNCNKTGKGLSNLYRWHGDNCKSTIGKL
jgi:hypothetical protein